MSLARIQFGSGSHDLCIVVKHPRKFYSRIQLNKKMKKCLKPSKFLQKVYQKMNKILRAATQVINHLHQRTKIKVQILKMTPATNMTLVKLS